MIDHRIRSNEVRKLVTKEARATPDALSGATDAEVVANIQEWIVAALNALYDTSTPNRVQTARRALIKAHCRLGELQSTIGG